MMWITILVVAILLCRFVPGPKCVTYCAFKKAKYRHTVNKLEKYALWSNSVCTGADFQSVKTEQLIKFYKDSSPFGCHELTVGAWVTIVRANLKETIAERLLLDIK